jgi:hypothetical protein
MTIPSDSHTLSRTNQRPVTPFQVKFLQSLSLSDRIFSNPLASAGPRSLSILKQTILEQAVGEVRAPPNLVEDNLVVDNPNAPHSDAPKKRLKTYHWLETSRHRTSKYCLRPIRCAPKAPVLGIGQMVQDIRSVVPQFLSSVTTPKLVEHYLFFPAIAYMQV